MLFLEVPYPVWCDSPFALGQTNCTGLADGDYPCLDTSLPALANLPLLNADIHHVPLPPELVEEFQSILMAA